MVEKEAKVKVRVEDVAEAGGDGRDHLLVVMVHLNKLLVDRVMALLPPGLLQLPETQD